MVPRVRVASLLLVVVGAVLVGVGVTQVAQGQYVHDVVEVTDSEIPGGADVMAYGNLSESGQRAVREAVESDDHESRVRADKRPPKFDYDGETPDTYYVAYEGSYYRVVTTGPSYGDGLADSFSYLLVVLGTVAVIAGAVEIYRGNAG